MDILDRKQIPNIITVIRFILIIPLAISLLKREYQIALTIFFIAGCSDGLDGFLARHFKWTSRFGAIADPLADKMLMLAAYILLGFLNKLPLWFVLVVIGRDIIILGGATAYNYFIERPKFSATLISKINTMFQLLLVGGILFSSAFITTSSYVIYLVNDVLMISVFITTIVSLIEYVWTWGRSAWLKSKENGEREPA